MSHITIRFTETERGFVARLIDEVGYSATDAGILLVGDLPEVLTRLGGIIIEEIGKERLPVECEPGRPTLVPETGE